MMKGKFWDRTGFMTKNFDEAVLWIHILTEKGLIFGMTVRNPGDGDVYYVFAVNVNSLIAEDLIEEEGFHDEFPIFKGGFLG